MAVHSVEFTGWVSAGQPTVVHLVKCEPRVNFLKGSLVSLSKRNRACLTTKTRPAVGVALTQVNDGHVVIQVMGLSSRALSGR